MRTASVFRPRSTSHASNGPATAPIEFWWKATRSAASSKPGTVMSLPTTTAPPTTSLWPPAYFVVEWHDDVGAERDRLLEVGRGEGVVDDEQGAGLVGQRRRCASMSAMPSSGLVGVSTQTILVWPGRIAARTASTSAMVRDGVLDPPRHERPC